MRLASAFFTEGSAGQLDRATMFLWFSPPLAERICYNIARQFNRCAFVALQARVKTGKLCGEPRWGECVRQGAFPFVISPRLFQGLIRNPTRDCALSFPCWLRNRGHRKRSYEEVDVRLHRAVLRDGSDGLRNMIGENNGRRTTQTAGD